MEDLPDTRMGSGPETIGAIERAIREFRPDTLYTHSRNDRHQDHRAVYEATCIAARNVPNVYSYQAPSTTTEFRPSKFVDVSSTLERKLSAIEAYESQAGRPYMSRETLLATAAYWGRFAQYGHVEPLEIHREA
jgi:LmbE family N-acetylglucosaminyl deacetylase